MAGWTEDELSRIGGTELMHLASRRPDGTLRPYVTMWDVRVGNDVYVRSAYGPDNGWYVRAKASGTGRIRSGGVERDVVFEDAAPDEAAAITAAYHEKYDQFGPAIVGTVTGPDAEAVTLRLVPADG